MEARYMNRNDILSLIADLAMSQGFYGRLYRAIMEADSEQREALFEEWEAQQFKDNIDFILYLES